MDHSPPERVPRFAGPRDTGYRAGVRKCPELTPRFLSNHLLEQVARASCGLCHHAVERQEFKAGLVIVCQMGLRLAEEAPNDACANSLGQFAHASPSRASQYAADVSS